MAKRQHASRRSPFALESLENRRLQYAADMPALVGLTDVRSEYPTITGNGQVVVVMDEGVNAVNYGGGNFVHPDLAGAIWTNPDDPNNGVDDDGDGLVDNTHGWNYEANSKDASDNNGHGTAIASVIAGASHTFDEDGSGGPAPSATYQGVAPAAKILPIKLYRVDSSGNVHWTTKERLNDAFKWVYDHAAQYDIASINMSWGFFGATRTSADANPAEADYNYTPTGGHSIAWYVDHLRTDRKVLIVMAAGNADNNGWAYPGREADEYAVGSLDVNGTKVWGDDGVSSGLGTQYGQNSDYLDILAPGWNVTANSTNSGYTLQPGYTSFATPWIAGAAALLKQVNPNLTPDQIMATLRANNAGTITDARTGWSDPVLDLREAVNAAAASQPIGTAAAANDIAFVNGLPSSLHFVWYNSSARMLMYASSTDNGVTWSAPEVVDAGAAITGSGASQDVGSFLSLDLDGSAPRVAYFDATNGDLRYAHRIGPVTAWVREAVDTGSVVGSYPAMKVDDASNHTGISYYDQTNGDLKFAFWDGTSWTKTTVDGTGDVGKFSSIEIDPNQTSALRFGIAYDDVTNTRLKYARQTGTTTWSTNVVDDLTGEAQYTDLAYDAVAQSDGTRHPAISYYDASPADLKLAYAGNGNGTAWSKQTVASLNTRGLFTQIRAAGRSGTDTIWDVVYLNKTGGTVVETTGTYAAPSSVIRVSSGVDWNVSVDWLGSTVGISYIKTDGTWGFGTF